MFDILYTKHILSQELRKDEKKDDTKMVPDSQTNPQKVRKKKNHYECVTINSFHV